MKPTDKRTNPSVIRFPVATLGDGNVDICHNLRPPLRGRGLCAIHSPVPLIESHYPGARLLPGGSRTSGDRRILFMEYRGNLLCLDEGKATALTPVAGKPAAILATTTGYVVMMGEGASPMSLREEADGTWSWRPAVSFQAPFAIVRKDEGLLSAEITAPTLHGSYSSRSASLTAADAAAYGKLIVDAYSRISSRAAARRVFFQPVMARYRVRGQDGSVLWLSAPVLVSPQTGEQLTGADFTLSGSGFSTSSGATLSARTFSLGLRSYAPLDSDWSRMVKCVEVLVSPQLHPLDDSLTANCTFGQFTTTSAQLHVALPGVDDRLASTGSGGSSLRAKIEALLSHLDTALETVASVLPDPATDEWGNRLSFYGHAPRDLSSEMRRLRTLLSSTVTAATPEEEALAALSLPHALNVSLTGVSGDCVVLGGLSATRFTGWLPADFAVEGTGAGVSDAYPQACKVTFADGSTSVGAGLTLGFIPTALSPLLVYPAADAVGLELYFDRFTLNLTLTPDPSGRYSYWLADDCRPVDCSSPLRPAFILPAASPRPRCFDGMLAVATFTSPLRPVCVTRVAETAPVAICASPSQSGGWDTGAPRFYLFGAAGIQALTVNTSRTRLTARSLDSRPVVDPQAVCDLGPRGVAAIAGCDLLIFSGQRVTTIHPLAGRARLGWIPARSELTCFYTAAQPCPETFTVAEGGEEHQLHVDAMVFNLDSGDRYSRSTPVVASLLSDASGLHILDAAGQLYDFTRELTDGDEVDICFRSNVAATDFSPSRRLFALPLAGSIREGHVEIRGDNGGGIRASDMLASWVVSGDIAHLPPCPVFTPHRHNLSLTIRASASSIRLSQP
ncbi:MAG: hypothetical protein NC212_04890 [Staphylococcus sp.]|nr:hypothetical protein [Staphylococcus sp.]